MSDADDYQDGRRLVHATLTPQEIDVALNRKPSIPVGAARADRAPPR
jgi:hypothetical protein